MDTYAVNNKLNLDFERRNFPILPIYQISQSTNILDIWDKVFKSGLSKFCGRQPLKDSKGYGLLKQNTDVNTDANKDVNILVIVL